jgi:hypothetical protein
MGQSKLLQSQVQTLLLIGVTDVRTLFDDLTLYLLGHDTVRQNSSPVPSPTPFIQQPQLQLSPQPQPQPQPQLQLQPQPDVQSEYEEFIEPANDLTTEYKMRLKHLGLYFEATTDDAYHLFLKKLPETLITITIQHPSSIFVVWSVSAPDNNVLTQAKNIKVGMISVADTNISLTFVPPSPIKLEFEKQLLNKKDEVLFAQYIFSLKIKGDELVDTAF